MNIIKLLGKYYCVLLVEEPSVTGVVLHCFSLCGLVSRLQVPINTPSCKMGSYIPNHVMH